jgi:holo-[acyl-carrier protein] synthase
MIVGIGIDIIEIERIAEVYVRHRERFAQRILTDAERAYVLRHSDPRHRLAGRWAAKEAALKALGTGLADGIGWKDCEILPDEMGKPKLFFHGKALARAKELGAERWHVTITHSETVAMAQVILES